MRRILFIGMMLLTFSFLFIACNSSENKGSTTTDTNKQEQLAEGEMYTCTMHNEVMSSKSGTCPKCGMNLVKQKMTPEQEKMMKEGTSVKSKEEQ
jgi:Cu(I)/Ag(I) efflux system membrane fusion protein